MVRFTSLSKPTLTSMICLTLLLGTAGCGRKGDPVPRPRAAPLACIIHWTGLRVLEATLPTKDIHDNELVGVEQVRVYFVPVGLAQPSPQDVLAKWEVILEKRRPDLPAPGQSLRLDLNDVSRPAGWVVVAAIRVGNVVGVPSEVIPWMDSTI
jgi:hypothetical protein